MSASRIITVDRSWIQLRQGYAGQASQDDEQKNLDQF